MRVRNHSMIPTALAAAVAALWLGSAARADDDTDPCEGKDVGDACTQADGDDGVCERPDAADEGEGEGDEGEGEGEGEAMTLVCEANDVDVHVEREGKGGTAGDAHGGSGKRTADVEAGDINLGCSATSAALAGPAAALATLTLLARRRRR